MRPPHPWESDPAEYRRNIKAEMEAAASGVGAGPSADEQVESAKANVRAQNAAKAQAPAPRRAVNIDNAVQQADALERHGDVRRFGGIKPVDKAAADAAFKADKDFAKKPETEQQDVARAKPAHTTSTPGAAPVPAVGAAMDKAGIKPSAPVAEKPKRAPVTPPSSDVSARNNMGVPRGGDAGSVLSGVASNDSKAELAAARAAATKGTRAKSGRQQEADAARSSSRRSAAFTSPVGGPQFSRLGGAGAEMSSAPGRDWITPSQISSQRPAPVANPAPKAPVPSSTATPATPSAPTTAPLPSAPHPTFSGGVVGGKPGKGITPAHMASSAPGRDWLSPQTANKAKTAAKAPKAAFVEPIAPSAKPEGTSRPAPVSAPSTPAPNRPPAPSLPAGTPSRPNMTNTGVPATPAPSRAPKPQNTGLNPAQSAGASDHSNAAPEALKQKVLDTMAKGMGGMNDLGKTPARTSTPVTTPSAPMGGGRSGSVHAAPRGEVGGGRGHFGGGDHSINVGGDNHGHITSNHNTYNINYGTNNGSMGNIDHGGGRAATGRQTSSGRGGGTPLGHGGGHHFDAWYRDSTGHHSLHEGIEHVTGKTGGNGEKLALPHSGKTASSGGAQRPINGSPRAAGQAPATPAANTGTTHNWQAPLPAYRPSASGNGTANSTP